MKKVLLFAAIATSMSALAQELPSTSGMLDQIPHIRNNFRPGTEKENKKIIGIYPHEKFGKIIHPQSPEHLTSTHLNDSIITWTWDVDINGWAAESRIINMAYDVNNNLTFFTFQNWDGNVWVNSDQNAYTYDTSNNLTFFTYQIWDGSAWVNNYQHLYTYDAKNNLTKIMFQGWDGSAWVNSSSQYTYTYDANNNKISEILDGAGFGSYSFTWTYSAKNNKTSEFYESPWGSYIVRWIYDGNSTKISEIYQGSNGSYMDKYRWNYFYNSHHDIQREEHWYGYNNDWGNDFDYNYTYTYDGKDNKTSEIKTKGHGLFTGENLYKYTFTYDDSSNLIRQYTGGWLGNSWVNYLQDTYTFDVNNNQTSHVYQQLNESTWKVVDQWLNTYEDNNYKTSESHKHFDLNVPETIVTEGDSTHYYYHTTTAVNDVTADDGHFNVYPNPSSGKFTISSKSNIDAIEIYNLLGERVYSDSKFNQYSSNDIDLSGQGKGIYFINVYNGKLMHSSKVIVQ